MTTHTPDPECQCSNGYECPHRCWHCKAARADGCETWCHIRPFDDEPTLGVETAEVIGSCDWCSQPFMTREQQQRHDCPDAPADDTGLEPYYSAIEERIYQLRERTCQWDETDGTTQEIARQAAIAAKDAAVEEWNPVCGRVAMRHQEVIDRLRSERDQARRIAVDLENQLAAVRDLHRPQALLGVDLCQACDVSWPCATARALDDGAQ